jgi:regulator of protease activity HflC (stomatin/prohibitin superfamily)
MHIYVPHLMSKGKLIDYQLDRGTTLNGVLGGYVVREYEYALLRIQGSERRTRIEPGKRIRRLNPFSVYELIRINQQNNVLNFELDADTQGLFSQVQGITTLQPIHCSISLTFRISDPHKLVVTNNIQSDADLTNRMVETLNNTFLKIARAKPQDENDASGTLFEFIAMPTIRLDEPSVTPDEVDGVAFRIPLRFRSENIFLGILRERFEGIGITPVDVKITKVDLPEEVRELMVELFETQREQAIAKEAAKFEMIEARKRRAISAADALTEIQKGLAKKTVEIDFYYGALMKYGLDAKTAMLFKTLETTLAGSDTTSGGTSSDPMSNLIRLYSLLFFKRVFDPGGNKLASLQEEMDLPNEVTKTLGEIKDPEVTTWISEKLRPLWDSLLLDQGLIGPEQYKEFMDTFKQAAGVAGDYEDDSGKPNNATTKSGESKPGGNDKESSLDEDQEEETA